MQQKIREQEQQVKVVERNARDRDCPTRNPEEGEGTGLQDQETG